MSYKLKIIKEGPNPGYDPKKARQYNDFNNPGPCPTIAEKILEVEVTEEEFKAIKKACLEVM